MSEPFKNDGHPKNHATFMNLAYAAVGGLSFTYGKLNGKAPINLIPVIYMGEFLLEIPVSGGTWTWTMKSLIRETENSGITLEDSVKRSLKAMKKTLATESAWFAAQNAVKEVILKLLSPNLSEIGEIKPQDPFGASRLIFILCRNFKAQVTIMAPSLNRELITLTREIRKACKDISGVSTLFQNVRQVLKMGETAKSKMISEEVVVSEIIAQLTVDDRMRQLALRLSGLSINLSSLELQIKNHISLFPSLDDSSAMSSLPSQGTSTSEAFYSHPVRLAAFPQQAFIGAQGSRREPHKSKRQNYESKRPNYEFKKSFSQHKKPQDDYVKRIPRSEWMKWSPTKRDTWLDLKAQQKKLRKQQIQLRKSTRSSTTTSSPEQSENEEANIAYHPSHRVYGHQAMFAQEHHAAYVVSQQVPDQLIETMVVDGGATSHLHHDSSKFNSIAPHKVPINTAKEGDVLWAEGKGDMDIVTRNNKGEFITLHLKNVLYAPTATVPLVSVNALRDDGYQTIYPEPAGGGIVQAGIYDCRKGRKSLENAIPLVRSGSLVYVQIFPQLQLTRPMRKDNLWVTWSKRLGFCSMDSLRRMTKACHGLEALKDAAFPRNLVSREARMGKMTTLDAPKSVVLRASQPMEKVHMDLKGPVSTPSFHGHKYVLIFVDDFSQYSWVFFTRSKAEVFDQIKLFFANTVII